MAIVSRKPRRGFTLVEIMISVLIIGILLSIAAPSMVRARESSRAKSCVTNLKRILGAKEMFAMDNRRPSTFTPGMGALVPAYLRVTPRCPGGGIYTVGDLQTPPTCSRGQNGGGAWDDHVLP